MADLDNGFPPAGTMAEGEITDTSINTSTYPESQTHSVSGVSMQSEAYKTESQPRSVTNVSIAKTTGGIYGLII